jgi:hypothetical protein
MITIEKPEMAPFVAALPFTFRCRHGHLPNLETNANEINELSALFAETGARTPAGRHPPRHWTGT